MFTDIYWEPVGRRRRGSPALTRCSAILCALCAACFGGGRAGWADEALRRRFLDEAPPSWLQYRQLVCHSAVSLHRIRATGSEERWVLVIDGSNALFRSDSHEGRKYCQALNAKYGFRITSRPEGSEWRVEGITARRGWQPPEDLIGQHATRHAFDVYGDESTYGMVLQAVCCGEVLDTAWFPRIVQSPDFAIVRVSQAGGGGGLVRVDFTYEPKDPEVDDHVRSGFAVLDPGRHWLICTADVNAKWGGGKEYGTISVTNEYDDKTMAFPFVRRMVEIIRATDGKARVENREVSEYEFHEPQGGETQFTLSAFGLPEPSVGRRRLPLTFWIAVAVVLVLTVTFGTRQLLRWRAHP